MLTTTHAFSGFSVNDLAAAQQFYVDTLGVDIEEQPGMGFRLKLVDGGEVFVYEKTNHEPASFTILNFVVADIDVAVDELVAAGVSLEHYADMTYQDEKGIARGRSAQMGPDIAWFKDPAGNILSVLQN